MLLSSKSSEASLSRCKIKAKAYWGEKTALFAYTGHEGPDQTAHAQSDLPFAARVKEQLNAEYCRQYGRREKALINVLRPTCAIAICIEQLGSLSRNVVHFAIFSFHVGFISRQRNHLVGK